jgi:ribosomal protein S18 acetylase RimI-like enzyme
MLFHPLIIALYSVALGIVSKLLYKVPNDIGIVFTTCAGITMAGMIAIRGAAGGYLSLAENLKWAFLKNDSGEEDIVLGSRFGDELIGALILRLERNPPSPTFSTAAKKKGSGNNKHSKTGGHGVIRAWTVRVRYRGKGVGTELLEEAIKLTKERLGGSAEVGFAKEHANSKMVVPEIFNGAFRKREARAAKGLERVAAELRKR